MKEIIQSVGGTKTEAVKEADKTIELLSQINENLKKLNKDREDTNPALTPKRLQEVRFDFEETTPKTTTPVETTQAKEKKKVQVERHA